MELDSSLVVMLPCDQFFNEFSEVNGEICLFFR